MRYEDWKNVLETQYLFAVMQLFLINEERAVGYSNLPKV